MEGMLRLGLGWPMASCSWLFCGFLKIPFQKPLSWPHPSIHHRRRPLRVLPYKDEDTSFWQPQALVKFAAAHHHIQSYPGSNKFAFSGFVPPASANTKPWEVPRSIKIPTAMQSSVLPTLCEGGCSFIFRGFWKPEKTDGELHWLWGGKGCFLCGRLLGPSRLTRGKSHILETIQAFLMRFL